MKKFVPVNVLVLLLLPMVALSGADSVIYGPEVFDRTEGAPSVYEENFSAAVNEAHLLVFNGDNEQDSRVSGGSIVLNGVEVISENDLNQQVDHVYREISLNIQNTMTITLKGQPGGYITVLIVTSRRDIPEFTAGRIHLAWTSISDPSVAVALRLKNGSPAFHRCVKIRFYNEDGSLAAVSERIQLNAHASLNTPVASFLPQGSSWTTGSLEILFAGLGGGRVLGYVLQTNSAAQTETTVPLQWGGIRHFFNKPKK